MKTTAIRRLAALLLALAMMLSLGSAWAEAETAAEPAMPTDFASRAMAIVQRLMMNQALRLSYTDSQSNDAAVTLQMPDASTVQIFTEGFEPGFEANISQTQALFKVDEQLYGVDFAVWGSWIQKMMNAQSYSTAGDKAAEAVAWLLQKMFEGAVTTDGTTTVVRLSGRELVEALDQGVIELLGGDFDLSWLEELLTAYGANVKAGDLLALWKQAKLSETMPQELADAYCVFTITQERSQMNMVTLIDGTISVANELIAIHMSNTYGRTVNGYGYSGYCTLSLPETPTLRIEYTLEGPELDAKLTWRDNWDEEEHSVRLFGHVGENVSLQLTSSEDEFYGALTIITSGSAPTATLIWNYDDEKTMLNTVIGETTQTFNYTHISSWYGTDTMALRMTEEDGMPVSIAMNWHDAYEDDDFSYAWNKTDAGFNMTIRQDDETFEAVCEDDQMGQITVVMSLTQMSYAYTDSEGKYHPSEPETQIATICLTADEETPAIRMTGEAEGEEAFSAELIGTELTQVEPLNPAEATFITPEMLVSMMSMNMR